MGYKGLYVKVQKLQAYYNNRLAIAEENRAISYTATTSKQLEIDLLKDFVNDLDNLLESEEIYKGKYFKY